MMQSSKVIAIVWAIAVPSVALLTNKLTEQQQSSDFSAARPSKAQVQATGPLHSGDSVYLRNPSHGNQYVEVHGDESVGYRVRTTSNKYGRHNGIATTQFTIHKVSGEGEFNDGDMIYLANPSHTDLYVSVSEMRPTSSGPGADAQFTIHRWQGEGPIMSGDPIFLKSPSAGDLYIQCHGTAGDGYAITTTSYWDHFYQRTATTQFTIHNWNTVSEINLGASEMAKEIAKDQGEIMKFRHILGDGIVDLVVTNTTTYTPDNADATGVDGDYGRINIACGTSTDFKFSFKSSVNGQPFTMEQFHFTFADLDMGVDEHCKESIMISGFDDYVLSEHTGIAVSDAYDDENIYKVFSATAVGTGEDNPQSIYMDDDQENRAVTFLFKDVQSFTIRYQTAGSGYAGRLLYFTGPTSLSVDDKMASFKTRLAI